MTTDAMVTDLPKVYRSDVMRPERMDPDALKVVRRLTEAGFAAYLVGGCVRDLLLGRAPKDFDIATSARPRQVRRLFRNSRVIGRRFKLVHVFFRDKIIEVATFRAAPEQVGTGDPWADDDGNGGEFEQDLLIRDDNRFGSARDDARRRDFPMNGLFYEVRRGLIVDYVDGIPDLRDRTIRSIGDPRLRLREDPVRILRAIRFAAKLGLKLDEPLHAAMGEARGELVKSATARVLEELRRLLLGGAAASAVRLLDEIGASQIVLPELAPALARAAREDGPLARGLVAFDRAHAGLGEVSLALLLAVFQAEDPDAAGPGELALAEAVDADDEDIEPPGDADDEASEDEDDEPSDEAEGDEGDEDDEAADERGDELDQEPRSREADEPAAEDAAESFAGEGEAEDESRAAGPIADLARRMRLPRRDVARCAQILMAQDRLASPARRRGRFRPVNFVRRDFFPEALALRWIHCQIHDGPEDAWASYEGWRRRYLEAWPGAPTLNAPEGTVPPAPEGASEDEGGGRRRRRHRRRGRGDNGFRSFEPET